VDGPDGKKWEKLIKLFVSLIFMLNCRLLGAKRTLSVAATLTFVTRSVDIPNFMFATTGPGEF
jgi:hypothetical protein